MESAPKNGAYDLKLQRNCNGNGRVMIVTGVTTTSCMYVAAAA